MLKEMYRENSYIASIDENSFALARRNKDFLNLSPNEEHRLRDWFMYDGCFYFLKYVDNLNEFIGEYLAKKMKLKSAHYIPVERNGNILVASENFKKMNCQYLTVDELEKNISLNEILNNPIYANIKKNIFKMFSVDMYMRQLDRAYPNVLFQIDTSGKLTLSPVFDYSSAFHQKNFKRYDNPILDIEMDKKKFDIIINKYPELYEYVKKVIDIELIDVLKEICEDFAFELKEEYKDYYLEEEDISKKILRKMI